MKGMKISGKGCERQESSCVDSGSLKSREVAIAVGLGSETAVI